MFATTCTTSASPSESARAGARHTVPAGSPSAGIPSKMTGLPGIKFATLGVSSAGRLGPNPYHPSPTVTNIPLDQISPPLLWNIWCVSSYQFVLKPLPNSYNNEIFTIGNTLDCSFGGLGKEMSGLHSLREIRG